MTKIFTARITYRNEKPYGVGSTAHERYTRIEAGWVAEIVDGLEDRQYVYYQPQETAMNIKKADATYEWRKRSSRRMMERRRSELISSLARASTDGWAQAHLDCVHRAERELAKINAKLEACE